ncbi:MAG: hypothetical protein JNK09_20800 [Prolixibacteraceae bacterium]|nr:hypothetical protein [Prolixibacteraceae bacterium]
MQTISLLSITSISQWALFAGIALVLFGLMEKREKTALGGQVIFILLGIFAAYIVLSNGISASEISGQKITKEVMALTYFKLTIVFALLNIGSVLLYFLKLRFVKTSQYIIVVAALMLFFWVFNIQQVPAT